MVRNTFIVSDIHLADAEPPHPKNPLWKRFKRPKHFVDRTFRAFVEYLLAAVPPSEGPMELVFNGDIFDFDSVMAVGQGFHLTWLERMRGLAAEEPKSRFKMKVILDDHPVWLESVRNWILRGNRAVFVIGNHDMELHWPSVRQDIIDRLELPEELRENVRFCEWFYVSGGDTLIEHGNQYDAYCLCTNPINPLIRKGSRAFVRIPFGNLAGKYMLNGMGLFNPHAESSYIKDNLKEYARFYYKYVMRTQPLLMVTWFWSACVTLVMSVSEGLLPAMTDPLTVQDRVADIAQRANSTPGVVWQLKELHVHPAHYNPFKILRELWLDRAILFAIMVFISFQFFSTLNVFVNVSLLWFIVPLALLLPLFIFYARSVVSEVSKEQAAAFENVTLSARITGVKRVVHGHTHHERHARAGDIEYLNTGTWSPAFRDVECTQPYGRKCFAWIRPGQPGAGEQSATGGAVVREAALFEWKDGGPVLIPEDGSPGMPIDLRGMHHG